MDTFKIFTILAPLAFIVGFALQRGNVCSVLAAREIVWTGRWVRLRGLLLASAWGLAILLPLTWFEIGPFKLSPQAMPGVLTVLAGMAYAGGCATIGACIFGVCSRTTAGHISFAFAIPAMGIGATIGQQSGLAPARSAMTQSMAGSFSMPLLAVWGAVVIWLLAQAYAMVGSHRRAGITVSTLLRHTRWRSALAAMIIGLFGSILFATDTAWFYPAAVKRLTLFVAGLSPTFPLDSLIGGGALFLGGMVAGLYNGRFIMRPPHLIPSIQAIVGGLIIGFAWALIPGGNDAMVLYQLPSLALNGIVGYASMLATLVAIEYARKRRSKPA